MSPNGMSPNAAPADGRLYVIYRTDATEAIGYIDFKIITIGILWHTQNL